MNEWDIFDINNAYYPEAGPKPAQDARAMTVTDAEIEAAERALINRGCMIQRGLIVDALIAARRARPDNAQPFKCNCPHETRSLCSEPRCPHYSRPHNAQIETDLTKQCAIYREALEIIAQRRQCLDNLMGNADVAAAALDHTTHIPPVNKQCPECHCPDPWHEGTCSRNTAAQPPATENPRHGSICWSCGAKPGDLHDPQCGYRTFDPNGRQPVRIPPVKEPK